MKVLIADDDSYTRFALKRILVRQFECTVLEAENGLDALEVAASAGDLAFAVLDVKMPVLTGLDVLRALRASAAHRALPVIVVTSMTEETLVSEFIGLGIADYIMKPVRADRVAARFERLIQSLAPALTPSRTEPAPGGLDPARPILIVDPNADFQEFCASVLTPRFRLLTADSGAQALKMCMSAAPGAVFIGSDIGLLGPDLLVRKLRESESLAQVRVVRVVPKGETDQAAETGLYDGVLVRTFVPEYLEQQVATLFDAATPLRQLLSLYPALRSNLVSAIEQVFGMMLSTEVALRENGPAVMGPAAAIRIDLVGEGLAIELEVRCPAEGARLLAARLTASDQLHVAETDITAALGEVANVITGRLQKALTSGGLQVTCTPPEARENTPDAPAAPADLALAFAAVNDGFEFSVGLSVKNAGKDQASTAA